MDIYAIFRKRHPVRYSKSNADLPNIGYYGLFLENGWSYGAMGDILGLIVVDRTT